MSFAANTLNPANLELPEVILNSNTPTDTWPIINNNTWSFTSLQKCFFFFLFQMSLKLVWLNLSM